MWAKCCCVIALIMQGVIVFAASTAPTPMFSARQLNRKYYQQLMQDNPYKDIELPQSLKDMRAKQCLCNQKNSLLIQQHQQIDKDNCLIPLLTEITNLIQKESAQHSDSDKYSKALFAKVIMQSEECDPARKN